MGLFNGKPPKPSALFDDLAPWRGQQQETPSPKPPARKLEPAPLPPRARPGFTPLRNIDPWGQHERMRELLRRVQAGEDFEAVKRELWADQYRGE